MLGVEPQGKLFFLGHFHACGKEGDLAVVGNRVAGGTAPPLDFPVQKKDKSVCLRALFSKQVLALAPIILEVEKLHGGEFLFLCVTFTRGAPSSAASG